MADTLHPLGIRCDAPPFPVVGACQRLGFRSPLVVRWYRPSHFLAARSSRPSTPPGAQVFDTKPARLSTPTGRFRNRRGGDPHATASGKPVATASAVHNPRAARYYFPFGGEVGYVTVAPAHRGKGLGQAVVARVVARLIEAGYRHIFVAVQGWRLPAVKCYLRLGFVPFLHTDELLPRWRRICAQIGWAVREAEWPRSLSAVATAGPNRAL